MRLEILEGMENTVINRTFIRRQMGWAVNDLERKWLNGLHHVLVIGRDNQGINVLAF